MHELTNDEIAELRAMLLTQHWTAHNIQLADGLTTIPGAPDMSSDTRLAAIRRIVRTRFGDNIDGLRAMLLRRNDLQP